MYKRVLRKYSLTSKKITILSNNLIKNHIFKPVKTSYNVFILVLFGVFSNGNIYKLRYV